MGYDGNPPPALRAFDETVAFFRDVLGVALEVVSHHFAWSRMPNTSQLEIFGARRSGAQPLHDGASRPVSRRPGRGRARARGGGEFFSGGLAGAATRRARTSAPPTAASTASREEERTGAEGAPPRAPRPRYSAVRDPGRSVWAFVGAASSRWNGCGL